MVEDIQRFGPGYWRSFLLFLNTPTGMVSIFVVSYLLVVSGLLYPLLRFLSLAFLLTPLIMMVLTNALLIKISKDEKLQQQMGEAAAAAAAAAQAQEGRRRSGPYGGGAGQSG